MRSPPLLVPVFCLLAILLPASSVLAATPIGYLDAADAQSISGWSVDPDSRTAALQVEVLVNGVVRATVTANRPRPDLVAAKVAPNPEHGFTVLTPSLGLAPGTYAITARGIDLQTGQRAALTNSKTVTIPNRLPIGYLDVADPQNIFGWSVDPDNRTAALQVEILVNGVVRTTVTANRPRPDLVTAGVAPNPEHGFSVSTLSLGLAPGTYTITARGVEAQTGQRSLLTNSKTVTIPPSNRLPIGFLDHADAQSIAGWSVDPDNRTAALQVEVLVNGVVRTTVTANRPRPDLVTAGVAPNPEHGFAVLTPSLGLAPGTYAITARGIDLQTGQRAALTNSKTVTITDTTPPSTPVVTDDGATTASLTQLHAGWTSSDAESGIAEYQYRITRDSANGAVLADWVSAGTSTEVTRTGLMLSVGATYFVSVKARNGAGLWSPVGSSDGIIVTDSTPPSRPVVTDDGATTTSLTQLHAAWSSADPESGIMEYQYRITSEIVAGAVLVDWTSVGTAQEVTRTGLSLKVGVAYFVSVKARNGAGLWSPIGSSDGITVVDATPPSVPVVTDDGVTTASLSELHVTWTASSDPESGVAEYQYQVRQDSTDGPIVRDWIFAGQAAEVTAMGLMLTLRSRYFVGIRAVNGAGLASEAGYSDGIIAGSTGPTSVGGDITSDTTWTVAGSPYIVTSTVTVRNGAMLTIEPGVEVRFNASTGLYVAQGAPLNQSGGLIARGTAAAPILFTSNRDVKTPGFWDAIRFMPLALGASAMEHCVVEYGGNALNAPPGGTVTLIDVGIPLTLKHLTVRGTVLDGIRAFSNPTIEDTVIEDVGRHGFFSSYSGASETVLRRLTVRNPGSYGIFIFSIASKVTLMDSMVANGVNRATDTMQVTGNTFSNYDPFPTEVGANNVEGFLFGNTLQGVVPGSSQLEIQGGTVSRSATWPNNGMVYVINGNIVVEGSSGPILTLSPGTEFRFKQDRFLQVGVFQPGGLIARGTASAPILFTSNQEVKTPGFWRRIILGSRTLNFSVMEHCVVEYGGRSGQAVFIFFSGAFRHLTIRKSATHGLNVTSPSARPEIRDCLITECAGAGILSDTAGSEPIIEHNRVMGNREGLVLSGSSSGDGPIVRNNDISGNTLNGLVSLNGEAIQASLNWWGSASGPSGAGPGSGDSVGANVLFEPWLGQPFSDPFGWVDAASSPDPFNPTEGKTTFFGTLSKPANWTITIKDSTGSVVKTFSGNGASFSQDWVGDDTGGAELPDGAYTFRMDAGESAAPVIGRISLDNSLPIADITSPAPNTLFSPGAVIDVRGTAGGDSFNSYTLEFGSGLTPLSWSPIVSSAAPVSDGVLGSWDTAGRIDPLYTLRLTVTTSAGKMGTESVTVRILNFRDISDSPDPFSPNGDGIRDAAAFTAGVTFPVNWDLAIRNGAGDVVRSFSGSGANISQPWDGTDDGGAQVPDGVYSYRFQGTHVETGLAITSPSNPVTVDATFPSAGIASPTEDKVFLTDDAIPFAGTAADVNFLNYTLSYGAGPAPASFTTLVTATISVSDGTLYTLDFHTLRVQGKEFPPGVYTFRLRVSDRAGNVSVVDRRILLDYLYITSVSSAPSVVDPYQAQSAGIGFTLNRGADVTLRFYAELSGQLVRTAVFNGLTAGANSISWDGKDSSGAVAPLEAYYFTVEGMDGASRRGAYNSALSPLLGPQPKTLNASVSSTGFDPYRNNPVQIHYEFDHMARLSLDIPGVRKLLNRALHVPGIYTELWDGRRDNGAFHQGSFDVFFGVPIPLPLHAIVLNRDPIDLVDFRAEGYLIHPTHLEISTLTYSLERDAAVSMTITDPNGNAVRTLLSSTAQQAGPQVVEWDGRTDAGRLVTLEGDYRVTLTAVDPVSGLSYTRLGTVRVYK